MPDFDRRRIQSDFGKAAAVYDAHAELQALIRADALRLGAGHWPETAHILDVGCGTGACAREARDQGLSLHFTAIDIAPGMCAQARRALPRVAAAGADALPFAEAAFDGLFSSLMLQWAEDTLAVLREMARVTRPGGIAVVTSFTRGTLSELTDSFALLDSAPHINRFLEPAQLSALAVHAGFALLHAEEERFTEYYSDAASLMRGIKAIGAGNKQEARAKGLMTPRRLAALESRYRESFGHPEKGLPATWNAMTLLLEKRI